MTENAHTTFATEQSRSTPEASGEKVYHTVTACVRCRQRKTRCDPALPRCEPCERSNARCEYYDSMKNRTISRTYITSLQANVRRLQAELAALEQDEVHEPDVEAMARGTGLIKFNDNAESRFLGPSSGIGITRFVLNLARQQTKSKSIKDVVPDRAVQEIKAKFEQESAKPTSKIYPLISSVAAPSLPSQELMERLVDIYMAKAQYLLPLLHEPSFRQDVQAVYLGSTDPTLNFQLRLVIAISMQRLDTQYAGLADSYYLASLPYLEQVVKKMDLSTLQCFALVVEYSVLTPTRTASYWVVGLASRLCQDLGLCDEKTIQEWPPGNRFNTLEVDLRRRLFWIITSMELGLAHSLGRPSALGVSVDNINVKYFELCDDRFITPGGLLSGHRPIMKKCLSIHFFKMRLLQAEIRRTLYLRKRDSPLNDEDPWFRKMDDKISDWVNSRPSNDEGSGVSELFQGRAGTVVVLLYRPSPQIPEPSLRAAQRCFDACVTLVRLQKWQIEKKMVDFTWILTQTMFMAVNTILWSLSYSEIRQQHPIEEVHKCLKGALEAIALTADRWPGVQSALQLYESLIEACLRAYETETSFVLSSSATTSPTSTQDVGSPQSQSLSADYSLSAAQSPVSTAPTSMADPRSPQMISNLMLPTSQPGPMPGIPGNGYFNQPPPTVTLPGFDQIRGMNRTAPATHSSPSPIFTTASPPMDATTQAYTNSVLHYSLPSFDHPQGLSDWNGNGTSSGGYANFMATSNMEVDSRPWLGYYGDEYSRYLQHTYFPGPQQTQSLDLQTQGELMETLEKDVLPDVSYYMNDSATVYPLYNQ